MTRSKEISYMFWGSVGLLMIPVFFWAMYEMFRMVDCNTARTQLAFIEHCKADADCTLRPDELKRYSGYVRMEIARCRED